MEEDVSYNRIGIIKPLTTPERSMVDKPKTFKQVAAEAIENYAKRKRMPFIIKKKIFDNESL